ncbi:uncharacterized protein [Miscanthus floridulus]|uniref:uncharacterized protein isoform X2 n=1 Tax=Miscanthus floridulus TaxID=154761 RepID=UPI003458ED14
MRLDLSLATQNLGGYSEECLQVVRTVLTNGIEVKLQRNALSVIEPPTGNEDDDKFVCENMQWNSSDMASDDAQSPKPQRSRSRQHRGFHRKSLSRSMSCDSHSKTSVSSSSRAHTKVDLSKLELTALWRYWRHFNLDACPNPSREQLVDAVQRHFTSQQLDELQVIVGFVQAAKRLKTTMKVA